MQDSMAMERFNNTSSAVEFSLRLFQVLRQHHLQLSTLQTSACVQAIESTQSLGSADLFRIYKVTLVNRKQDLPLLQQLYARLLQIYFSGPLGDIEVSMDEQASQIFEVQHQINTGTVDTPTDTLDDAARQAYSTAEVDQHKDFRLLPHAEFPAVLKALEAIARQHAALIRRKYNRSPNLSVIDLRASVRESAKFDGDIFDWRYRRKTPTHTRITVVVDVSGSMEVYSLFLLNFLHQLYRNRHLKIEVFVFSTELQPLTKYFQSRNFRAMLDRLSVHFSGWSGGTKIGAAIASLNHEYSAAVTKKTVVTIMSDGWDTGDIALLGTEMKRLAARAKSLVWINPLKGDPGYEPLAAGMAAARPHCDEFISGHSIDSLKRFAFDVLQ